MSQIKIYGAGCDKFYQTIRNIKNVLSTGGVKASFSVITNSSEIVKKGAINLLAVIIDNKLISQGSILSVEKIKKELEE